jgi:hypothetical protein
MSNLDQAQLDQIVAAVIAALGNTGIAPKNPLALPPTTTQRYGRPVFDAQAKDRSIAAAFARKGFKPVILMDRNDPSKDFNIRPFKGWLALGRVVRRGQKSVKGLFHVDQTDLIDKTPPKPKGGKPKVRLHAVPASPPAA